MLNIMTQHGKNFLAIIKNSFNRTIDNDGVEHAGYLCFLVIFCLFPFIFFIISITNFLGAGVIGQHLVFGVLDALPAEIASFIAPRIKQIASSPPHELLTIAVLSTVWTSSSFVEALRTIFNRIYNIQNAPNYIWRRLLSTWQFILLSVILLGAVLALILLPLLMQKLIPQEILVDIEFGDKYFRSALLLIIVLFVVSQLYSIIPNKQMSFVSVIPGSILTISLWYISGKSLSLYVKYYSQLDLIYGSLANIIITIFFFFIANLILIFGAEFNYQVQRKYQKTDNI